MINLIEATTQTPVCPHCEAEIRNILVKQIRSFFGVRSIYFCEHCHKTLGVSHRKGFWMG